MLKKQNYYITGLILYQLKKRLTFSLHDIMMYMQFCAIKDKIPFFIQNIFFLLLQIYKHTINTVTPRTTNAIGNNMPVDDPSFACFSLKKKQIKINLYMDQTLTLNIV